MLVLGVVAALALGWASLVVTDGAEWSGRLALSEAVEEWEALVAREWERFDLASVESALVAEFDRGDLGALGAEGGAVAQDGLFFVLLREARRLERVGEHGAGAVDAGVVDAAFAAAAKAAGSASERAIMRLADVQRDLARGAVERARAHWAVARDETPELVAREAGTSVTLLMALALSGVWDAEERREVAALFDEWAQRGVWVLGAHAGDVAGAAREVATLEVALGSELPGTRLGIARRAALLEWVAGMRRVGGARMGLLSVPANGAQQPQLARAISELEMRHWLAEGGRHVLDGVAVVELRGAEAGSAVRALGVGLPELRAAFLASLADHPVWGPDVWVSESGAGAGARAGEVVRTALRLGDGLLEVDLWHRDPAGFVAQERKRQRGLRVGLFALGVGFLGAGLLGFVALRRQRQLAALKSEFIAKVSHELRTPVAGILLAAEGLERAPDAARSVRYVGLIHREARRLERLVANVLDVSRLERGRADWLRLERAPLADALPALVEHVLERAPGAAPAVVVDGHTWAPGGGLPRLAAGAELCLDREALARALLNLLDNARQHGGAQAAVQWDLAVADAALVLGVEDDGPGIAASEAQRVFEAFHQAPRAGDALAPHKGAGLGLAIVREIVAGHNGELRLTQAATGRLARFEIELPLTRTTAPESSPPTTPPKERP